MKVAPVSAAPLRIRAGHLGFHEVGALQIGSWQERPVQHRAEQDRAVEGGFAQVCPTQIHQN